MAACNVNTVRVYQTWDDGEHWVDIELRDSARSNDTVVRGTWRHAGNYKNNEYVTLTDDNPEYWYWTWTQSTKELKIATKMGDYDDTLVVFKNVQRNSDGSLKAGNAATDGVSGTINHDRSKFFTKERPVGGRFTGYDKVAC
jgi:hypothetical protein